MNEHHHDHGSSAQEAARDTHLRNKLAIAFGFVFGIVVVQAVGAFMTGTLVLLVDVDHSFADSLGLFIALVTAILMGWPARVDSRGGEAKNLAQQVRL
ncbi:cation diffusion facilitator family transporter [Actinotignum urinale]|uniref:Cation transporter n=1 Tax=Actinotignum urinale TaxID=190146 RepID=A0AAW9HXA4_9ACTO|nr:cation transporter [Actinotignum urinale]MDY5155050.1 cation transporter [Actinotignum urinale]